MMTFVLAVHLAIPAFVGAAAAAMTDCKSRWHAARVGALAGLVTGILFLWDPIVLLVSPAGALGGVALDLLIRDRSGTSVAPRASNRQKL